MGLQDLFTKYDVDGDQMLSKKEVLCSFELEVRVQDVCHPCVEVLDFAMAEHKLSVATGVGSPAAGACSIQRQSTKVLDQMWPSIVEDEDGVVFERHSDAAECERTDCMLVLLAPVEAPRDEENVGSPTRARPRQVQSVLSILRPSRPAAWRRG